MDIELATAKGQVFRPERAASMGMLEEDECALYAAPSASTNNSSRFQFRFVTIWTAIVIAALVSIVYLKTGFVLFLNHPLWMLLAWIAACTEAIVVYRPLPTLLLNPRRVLERHRQREVHRWANYATCFGTLAGLVFILWNKIAHNKAVLPHTVHAYAGVLVILAVLFQVGVGQWKYLQVKHSGVRLARWHGKFGKFVFLLAYFTMASGFYELIHGINGIIALLLLLSTFVLILFIFYLPAQQANLSSGYRKVSTISQ